MSTQTDSDQSVLTDPRTGKRLRIMILVANIAFGLLVSGAAVSRFPRHLGFLSESVDLFGLRALVESLRVAILSLAIVLAAWGPWKSWVRAVLYSAIVVAVAAVQEIIDANFGSLDRYHTISVKSGLVRVTDWLIISVPAIYCLVLSASWLRVRLGPLNLPPPRVSIFGVMLATTIVGLLMAIRIQTQASVAQSMFSIETVSGSLTEYRFSALTDVTLGGPIAALLIGCMVASAYRWWPRCLAILLIAGSMGFNYYLILHSAPQFPRGAGDLQLRVLRGTLLGMMIGWLWIAVCIRLLDRSGWPCCRRAPRSGVAPQTPVVRMDAPP